MIQRFQSLYLFLVVVLMMFIVFTPFAHIEIKDKKRNEENHLLLEYNCRSIEIINGVKSEKIYPTLPILFLASSIGILSFLIILLFRNRNLQKRLCIYNILLLAGLIVLIVYFYLSIAKSFNIMVKSFIISAIFPLISIILILLAYKGIAKDELLVKSYERLRTKK